MRDKRAADGSGYQNGPPVGGHRVRLRLTGFDARVGFGGSGSDNIGGWRMRRCG
jgi:hypothetical protein